MVEIIDFNSTIMSTKLNNALKGSANSVNDILEQFKDKLKDVLVIGYSLEDEGLVYCSNEESPPLLLWMLELTKKELLKEEENEER